MIALVHGHYALSPEEERGVRDRVERILRWRPNTSVEAALQQALKDHIAEELQFGPTLGTTAHPDMAGAQFEVVLVEEMSEDG